MAEGPTIVGGETLEQITTFPTGVSFKKVDENRIATEEVLNSIEEN
ncbi:MAG: hypothetical protein MI921_02585 [Cytophagales bacterium]|nr:hypothetical protein [Cytophagales bacterium]